MNEQELDALITELDRGVTNVLENQLVKNKTSLMQPQNKAIERFHTTAEAGRRTSEVVNANMHKQGLVVFVDDNFINHQAMQMQF